MIVERFENFPRGWIIYSDVSTERKIKNMLLYIINILNINFYLFFNFDEKI